MIKMKDLDKSSNVQKAALSNEGYGQGSATFTRKRAILPPFLAIKICLRPQNIFEPHNESKQL